MKVKIIATISFVLLAAMIILSFSYGGLGDAGSFEIEKEPKKQRSFQMPNVSFNDLEGTPVKLESFLGKIVLLNFWASWCGPCAEEFPAMLRMSEKFKDDMVFVAVSNDEELSDVKKFMKLFEKDYSKQLHAENVRVLRDKSLEVTQNNFNVVRLPETFIIDKNGVIVRKVIGAIDWDGKEIHSFVEKLIK